jgi:acetyltransferase-like isoleucine patch superfamily enzyme
MKILEKLKKKIIKKIAKAIHPELEKIKQRKAVSYTTYHGFKKIGENSFFWGKNHKITGSQNFDIGNNVHINDGAYIRAEGGVTIGDNTHISRNMVLYSVNHDYKGNLLPYDNNLIHKEVVIGKNVWIGMNVCIVPGTIIGDGCIIGMGTTVSGNIPPLSIVGSAKAVVIGQRDANHYNLLDFHKKYGGIDGHYYKRDQEVLLKNTGDQYLSLRAITELVELEGNKVVKKTYLETPDGKKALSNEISAYRKFEKYSWCPHLLKEDGASIFIEYFPPESRLDKVANFQREELLGEILWCLLDIYAEGFSHGDFHAKNIYITTAGVKITDFETARQQPLVDFYDSYDITGQGHESAFLTENMCIMHPSSVSISSLFNIKSISQIKTALDERFESQLLDSSLTFKTLRAGLARHVLQTKNIYASFDLKNTKIDPKIGQRNTEKRLTRFGVGKNNISGKTILDIGSNIGATLLGLSKYTPGHMLGLEYDADKVFLSNKLVKYNQINNLEFKQCDIEHDSVPFDKPFDIVFCLAVIEHLKQKDKLFNVLGKLCGSTLYFEGNGNSDIEYIEQGLKRVGFVDIRYLGLSDDEKNGANNNRPLFIASKK